MFIYLYLHQFVICHLKFHSQHFSEGSDGDIATTVEVSESCVLPNGLCPPKSSSSCAAVGAAAVSIGLCAQCALPGTASVAISVSTASFAPLLSISSLRAPVWSSEVCVSVSPSQCTKPLCSPACLLDDWRSSQVLLTLPASTPPSAGASFEREPLDTSEILDIAPKQLEEALGASLSYVPIACSPSASSWYLCLQNGQWSVCTPCDTRT